MSALRRHSGGSPSAGRPPSCSIIVRGLALMVGLVLLASCGARTDLSFGPAADGDAGVDPTFEPVCPPASTTRSREPCAPLDLEMETQASCSIRLVSMGDRLDGEAFQMSNYPSGCFRVLAIS